MTSIDTTLAADTTSTSTADTATVARMRSLGWGIEIETVGRSREVVAMAVAKALGLPADAARCYDFGHGDWQVVQADGRVWKVMHDGSLSMGGAEIVSPILRGTGEIELIQAIIREVRAAGAKSSAADNCGIHVHIGAEGLDGQGVSRLAKIVSKFEPMATDALQIAAERSSYCKAIPQAFIAGLKPKMTKDQVSALWYRTAPNASYPTRYDHSRYHGCNLNSYFYRGTVEFRWFNGSLHAGEVKAYVQLCLALVARAETSKSASATPIKLGGMSPKARMGNYIWMTLQLRGAEWSTLRTHLTKHLSNAKPTKAPQAGEVAPAEVAVA